MGSWQGQATILFFKLSGFGNPAEGGVIHLRRITPVVAKLSRLGSGCSKSSGLPNHWPRRKERGFEWC